MKPKTRQSYELSKSGEATKVQFKVRYPILMFLAFVGFAGIAGFLVYLGLGSLGLLKLPQNAPPWIIGAAALAVGLVGLRVSFHRIFHYLFGTEVLLLSPTKVQYQTGAPFWLWNYECDTETLLSIGPTPLRERRNPDGTRRAIPFLKLTMPRANSTWQRFHYFGESLNETEAVKLVAELKKIHPKLPWQD